MAVADLVGRARDVALRVRGALDPLRVAYENLNPRERLLVGLLGVVAVVLAVGLPFYLARTAMAELADENEEIQEVLREIARSQALLEQRKAERAATEARYARRAPPLGSFVEEKARNVDLGVREVTDEPEQKVDSFTRREVRVSLPPNQKLEPVLRLLADIENSEYPVAVERLRIEHFQQGEDRFNVQFAVAAYDRDEAQARRSARADRDAPRVGPPVP